uniref:CRAL-TRIO domain-containing protein n=1 Tax=Globodera rostochiensis TaxID=31243 RepID=A0A914HHW9_GLORO
MSVDKFSQLGFQAKPELNCNSLIINGTKFKQFSGGKRRRIVHKDPPHGHLDTNCTAIRARWHFVETAGTAREANFPLAFARTVFNLSSEEPWYKISYIHALARCFTNVVVLAEQFSVFSNGKNVTRAQLACLEAMLPMGKWKYALLLQAKKTSLRIGKVCAIFVLNNKFHFYSNSKSTTKRLLLLAIQKMSIFPENFGIPLEKVPSMVNAFPPPMSAEECQWVSRMRNHRLFQHHAEHSSDFDLLRWALAYRGDVEVAIRKYRRHLRVRQLLRLDDIEQLGDEDGIDEGAELYAPMEIVGTMSSTDGRILLLERSGQFELDVMMKHIRTSAFMLNRFRLMERVLRAVHASERASGQPQSAVLLMDLEGMCLQANLVGFISGPYRIMWGTLIEQYPQLISSILLLNAPTFINVLWSACVSFIGDDYRRRVHVYGTNWRERIAHAVPLDALPEGQPYGGRRPHNFRNPQPCRIAPLDIPSVELSELCRLNIPAGAFVIQTFFLSVGEQLQFLLRNETEITMNIFFSFTKKFLHPDEIVAIQQMDNNNAMDETNSADPPELEEVFAGCERPGMPTLDTWKWRAPKAGFYHLVLGNEKAWIMPVSVEFQLFQLHPNGTRVKLRPIPV